MRAFAMSLVFFFASLPLIAQNWVRLDDVINPMTDRRFVAFKLKGEIDSSGAGTTNMGVQCSGGKFQWAGFAIGGMIFASSYILTTPVTLRIGNRLSSENLSLTEDRTTAQIFKISQLRDIDSAGSLIVEFKDAVGTTHYAKFLGASFTPELLSQCGGLAKKERKTN
jgi:hypothetical protein